jgi:hypothetical protein
MALNPIRLKILPILKPSFLTFQNLYKMKIIFKTMIIHWIIIFTALNIQAQDHLDSLMTRRVPTCHDMALNGMNLMEEYYKKNRYDSVNQVLDYWEAKCGMSEPLMRMKILMAIQENRFSESLYNQMIMHDLMVFMNHPVDTPNQTHLNKQQKLIVQTVHNYHTFTKTVAQQLLPQQQPKTLEYFFCALYADQIDAPFEALKQLDKPSRLQTYYETAINQYRFLPDLYTTISTGFWLPQQKAQLLGNHPYFGFGMGWQKRKMRYLLSIAFRFRDTRNAYQTLYKGNLVTTNHFFGGYFGADVERTLLRKQKHQLEFLGGIAWDGFDAIKTEEQSANKEDGKSINSVNVNFGLGYKYFYNKISFLGFNTKYNFVNYKNTGGTDLSGNTVTIGLTLGFLWNESKQTGLKSLRYKNYF